MSEREPVSKRGALRALVGERLRDLREAYKYAALVTVILAGLDTFAANNDSTTMAVAALVFAVLSLGER